MRLNQFISASGFCSRRKVDKLIKEGKVTVNGEQISLGHVICEGDRVEVDGQLIEAKENDIYLMLNKPPGVTCTAAGELKGILLILLIIRNVFFRLDGLISNLKA